MDDIKFVINELNNEPFKKNLNIISYDNLTGSERIKILFQIFQHIDEKINVESLEVADGEEVVITILEMLKICKYSPPSDVDVSTFRQGLVTGEPKIMTHITYYLLQNLPELKKRAYLARFLIKIEVSPDVEGDQDVSQLISQNDQLIQEFKAVHNAYKSLKKNLKSVQEMQRDIKSMEEEREQITEKLSTIKRKVDENYERKRFKMTEEYIEEKEKNKLMMKQIAQQEEELGALNLRLINVRSIMKDFETNFDTNESNQSILEKIEADAAAKRHLVQEVLPNQLKSLQRYVQDLEEIESQPSLGTDLVEKINDKIQKLNQEINLIMERRMLQNDQVDDKLASFRNKSAEIKQQRASLQNEVNQRMIEFNQLKSQLHQIKDSFEGEELLKGDDLVKYMNDLRAKQALYKQQKKEHKHQVTILSRTEEILQSQWKELEQELTELEKKRGIEGYYTLEDGLNKEEAEESQESLKESINQLNQSISDKKSNLALLIKELKPLKRTVQDLQIEFDKKKALCNSIAADLETSIGELEMNLKTLREEKNNLESNLFRLNIDIEIKNAYQDLIHQEMQYYVSTNENDKAKSFLNKLDKAIVSEDEKKEGLREKYKAFQESESKNRKQLKMWKDLKDLFSIKQECLDRKRLQMNRPSKTDHLIL